METSKKWQITKEEKAVFIQALTDELPTLRAKADIPQDDLAKIIGISRQTYGAIERQDRSMSWNTYLSLIFFFDYNKSTHRMIRKLSAFPSELIDRMNNGDGSLDVERIVGISTEELESVLDEQALHAIRTLVMVEYARCTKMPGEAVIKSFDGKHFTHRFHLKSAAQKAIKRIKGSKRVDL